MEQNLELDNNDTVPGSDSHGQTPTEQFQTQFKHAAAFDLWFNLIFRVMHNVVFACFVPRHRVYISLGCMASSMLLIGGGIHMYGGTSIAWVYVAYTLGGVAMGMFETNLLNSTLDLGHGTKTWSILGMPGEPARLPCYARPDSALTPPGPGARSRLRLDVCGRLPRPGSADQPTRSEPLLLGDPLHPARQCGLVRLRAAGPVRNPLPRSRAGSAAWCCRLSRGS